MCDVTALGTVTLPAFAAAANALIAEQRAPILAWGADPKHRAYVAVASCPHGNLVSTTVRDSDYSDLYYDNAERLITLWYEQKRRAWADGCCATQEGASG